MSNQGQLTFRVEPGSLVTYNFDEEGHIEDIEHASEIGIHDNFTNVPIVSENEDNDTVEEESTNNNDNDIQQPTDVVGEISSDEISTFNESQSLNQRQLSETSSVNSDDYSFNMNNSVEEHEAVDETEISTTSDDKNISNEDEIQQELTVEQAILNRPKRAGAGSGVDRIKMNLHGKSYDEVRGKQFLVKNKKIEIVRKLVHVVFTQMQASKGIKKYGQRAVAALFKELKQLDQGPMEGKPVVQGIDPSTLSELEKREALEAVNLIKEKSDRTLKGRTCGDGSKQRRFLKGDENYASPTATLESILITLVIDAYESRDIAIADIPGAYLHALWPEDKKVLLKLRGRFVDIMCEVNPEYKAFVVYEGKKEQKVLYLHVLRALYGCLESALLWYNLYSKTLKDLGFEVNPYDKCVVNKMINGSQCTIVFLR